MDNTELVVIGGGPAGLSAAIYAARAGVKTCVFGCKPKIAGDYEIDNYFGFPETVSGRELIERGVKQAERFGVKIECERVLGAHADEFGGLTIKTDAREIKTLALIIATGVSRVRPGISNLADFEAKGVFYCVSCDGFFYRGKEVAVVGEAVFAANQALELTTYTPKVRIFTQAKEQGIPETYLEKLSQAGVELSQRKVVKLAGGKFLEKLILDDASEIPCDGLFIAMGEASSLDFAYSLGLMRTGVFIDADAEQRTNLPGVFAAGDCTGGFMQISVAVGEGAKAARSAINYVKEHRAK